MSGENSGPLDRLTETIEASNRFPMVYIHGSKINSVIQCFRKIPHILRKNPGKIANYGMSGQHIRAVQSILSIITQIQDLSFQCSKDMCVQFLLASSIQKPYNEIQDALKQLYKDFTAVEVPEAAELFKQCYEEIDQQNIVDMKRIAMVLDQIKKKNREDTQENLAKRFRSLKQLGISPDETSESVAIPDLPENLRVVINRDDWILGRSIGAGVSGNVFLGKNKKTGEENVAIKVLHKKQLTSAELESYQREVYALSVLVHPCLLKFCGYTEDPPYYILTEYMANGCLFDILRKKPQVLTPTIRSLISLDIARGLEYLHSKGVIHRDMKSLNILLDNNYRARICDFGFVRSKNQQTPMTGMIGTAHWMAPEVLLSTPNYDEKVDVYSYAILLWELLTNQPPFAGMNPNQITDLVINQGYRPEIPEDAPPNLAKLINKCWQTNPEKRLTMSRVVRYLYDASYHFTGTDEAEFEAAAGPKPKSQFDLSGVSSSLKASNPGFGQPLKPARMNKSFSMHARTLPLNAIPSGPVNPPPLSPMPNTQPNSPQMKPFSNEDMVKRLNSPSERDAALRAIFVSIDESNDKQLVEMCMPYFLSIFDNQDKSLGTLLECMGKTTCPDVFEIAIMKQLLSFSASEASADICEKALLALTNGALLRIDFIVSSPSFVIQMLSFIKKPLSDTALVALFNATTKIIERFEDFPDRLASILTWSISKMTTDTSKKAAILSLAASMKFVAVRSSFESFDEWFGDETMTPALVAFASAPEKVPSDAAFLESLKARCRSPNKSTLEVVCAVIQNNQRFEFVPPGEFYATIISSRSIPEQLQKVPAFYDGLCEALKSQPEAVCELLKTASVDSNAIEKSQLPRALAETFASCSDDKLCILLMAAMYGAACGDKAFFQILPHLTKAVFGPAVNRRLPAFLCISKLLPFFQGRYDAGELIPAAAYYVHADNRTTRKAAAKMLKENITLPSVDFDRAAMIFVDNFSSADESTKEAVEAFAVASQSKQLDHSLRQKLSAIYQKTH